MVGKHDGLHMWTLGQRCRLHSQLRPYYVAKKSVQENVIYVASGHDHLALMHDLVHVQNINWLSEEPFAKEQLEQFDCFFRFQHTKPLVKCTIVPSKRHKTGVVNQYVVRLEKPLRALTPGQYAVFYNDTECLGSARILSSEREAGKHGTTTS